MLGLKRLHGFLEVTAVSYAGGKIMVKNRSRIGINKWYQSLALRNFDLEDIELEYTNSGPTAKLPILKLGEYKIWAIRIKQYFHIQDYALWKVIENEEKIKKKNNVKARGLLLMALPNEHQLTFSQYPDAKSMFAAIETRFGGFDWSDMAEEQVLTNMALMAFSDSEGKPQHDDKGFVDSGCSRHMTGNIAHLSDFKEFDRGYVAFRGGAYGGRITGKGTLKTNSLDFKDVHFVNELKFNLFNVSQMCNKKNYVIFTDTECLVLSPNFKLPDENQILLKIPRKDNMYSFDMKNIVPKESLTYLIVKATLDESMLWHRRLGHINFKNINKLVKDNLVRGLPTKHFENDQTCVACLKGKQHRAFCKSKVLNPITKPLFMLHMDLFGPTFVSSLMHKKYCLVVTDDYSRFTWVFFLTTKDETSEILKNFIKEIENLVDNKVKIIRSNNGTEFKNKVMDDFCGEKADSKLPTTFLVEVVSTPCYVQNRVLVVKPHDKTPYELFRGFKPALSFMRPFACHITILNTLDNLVTSYFDSPTKNVENGELKTVDDAQKQVEDSPNNENVEQDNPDVNIGSLRLNVVGPSVNIASSNEQDSPKDMFTMGAIVPNTPNTRIHKDHPIDNVIGEVQSTVQTRRMLKPTSEQGFLLSACIEPTSIAKALSDSSWVEAMHEELLQFKHQTKFGYIVILPNGKKAIVNKIGFFENKKEKWELWILKRQGLLHRVIDKKKY
ncbi:putative ribonuclease H-like domain-containing protein [Tanacetum coccineum]|uniref:Ribonuclease H-like domain-containing protein n=1 Tax=Tanacetum coccineum TaxID=301880 RepID=A0ABQ4XU68_9ASTR